MKLDDRQLITYLANVLHVARADGVLTPQEQSTMESIRLATGAKKGPYTAASRAAESPSYSLLPVGTFATRVANLEDMFRISFSDGDIFGAEKSLLEAFASAIGVLPSQLELIQTEIISELGSAPTLAACVGCGATLPDGARFCAGCGTAVSVSIEATVVSYEIPTSGCAIEFAESTAASFQDALQLAKASPAFQTCIKGKKTWYLVSYPKEEFTAAAKLATLLGGMRNRRSFLDGQEVSWDELFGFTWCANERANAYRPPLYCFGKDDNRLNPWGCKNAGLEWTEWADWFSYGRWESSGVLRKTSVFVFDKERIRHELSSNLHRFRFCPHIRQPLIEAILAALPARVQVEKGGSWAYAENYDERPGSIRIKETETSDGYSFTKEFWTDGVRPRGLVALRGVLSAAFQSVGVDASVLNAITG